MSSGHARSRVSGPTAIELIEESVHLLRRTPPQVFCIYYGGTVPFVLALIFYWARTTWFQPEPADVALSALALVGWFAVMKAAQAEFCGRLLAQRLGATLPGLSGRRLVRLLVAQAPLQAWGIVLLPAAALIGVPFGWVYAYVQSATVLGDDVDVAAQARAQAKLWPGQNHLGQLLLSGVFLAVWANVAISFWMVPWLANRLLGLDNIFGFSGWSMLNSTFVASTALLSWLVVDPLVKAFFTLRVFYGRARRNGEDLRVELEQARGRRARGDGAVEASTVKQKMAGRAAVMLVWFAAVTVGVGATRAKAAVESNVPVRSIEPAKLNEAIERVLEGRDFQWRLRPMPRTNRETDPAKLSPVRRFLHAMAVRLEQFAKWMRDVWRGVRKWVSDLFPGTPSAASSPGKPMEMATIELLLWVFVVGVAGLLLAVLVIAWRRRQPVRRILVTARAVTASIPDLQDEQTQAAQLPPEGWLQLAREQLARGEWRLAWRALYLATLARLASQGFLSLARFKTNLDYERELRRRALSRQEMVAWFARRRVAFEAVWYGRASAEENAAREWLAELERTTAP